MKSVIIVFFVITTSFVGRSWSIKDVNPADGLQYRPMLRAAVARLRNFIDPRKDDTSFNINMKRGKIQKQFNVSEPFFCDLSIPWRSRKVPTSVHKLRPGDIDVIAAMGDSLTTGNGAMATNILQILFTNKKMSWSGGGEATWRKFLTLPNILKEFNPNLYGYSHQKGPELNVAVAATWSRDLPFMAQVLVNRMKNETKIDLHKHWKLITLLVGANDFCSDVCHYENPEVIAKLHEKNLLNALRILRDNLPRTMVNVISTPDVTISLKYTKIPLECIPMQHFFCSCFFSTRFGKNRKKYKKVIHQWHAVEKDVTDRDEFHNLTDFTVNYNPFTINSDFQSNDDGTTDYRYLSDDCFHFSQRGYARAVNAYWNNMLEPYGRKSTTWKKEFTEFKCPTKEMPYLRTKGNS
ncbi:phospholipase B1, membrane-associated-like [Culicoides brevitarsis]|uniref:phospholipase B1, membrane-associated-like n=1 Tax=Culicoides brevitarsis TaxID=469753 RepID=UPI00307C9B63